MDPKVSIVMPVYNVEKYLGQCLDSVINQTLRDIEIICVDDGSTDDSLGILEDYSQKDNRIRVLHQQNQHAGVARNNGMNVARGKYIIFLDSDDVFELNMLEEMVKRAEKDDSDVTVCGWKSLDDRTNEVSKAWTINEKYIQMSPLKPADVVEELYDICKPNPWTKLIKREFLVYNSLQFDDCICCNDITCICLSLSLARRISLMEECFVYYREYQTLSLTSNRNKNFDSVIYALLSLERQLKEHCVYKTFENTYAKKVASSVKYKSQSCSKKEREERKQLCRKIFSDKVYYAIYKEPKISQKKCHVRYIQHTKFF